MVYRKQGWVSKPGIPSIKSILLEYCDKILEPPFRLPTHIMEGRVKILETWPKSEEIISFCLIFLCMCRSFIAI